MINIIAATLTIPIYFSLFGLHYKKNIVLTGMAFILFLLSFAVFMADNVAFSMLALSQKYSVADPISRELLAAAGEALLAKGISHTPGTFPGFFLSEIAAILFSIAIIKGDIYKTIVGILGVSAFSMILIFEVISSFFSEIFSIAMIFAALGGITALLWYILMGLGLYIASKYSI